VRAYIEDWLDTFAEFRVDLVELIDVDDETVCRDAAIRRTHQAQRCGATRYSVRRCVRRQGWSVVDGGEYETRAQALRAAEPSD
jgi:hypothetical protein